jgi:hypothetical protein
MLYQHKATPAEYKAGLDLAIARGLLRLHESGTYVKFTPGRCRAIRLIDSQSAAGLIIFSKKKWNFCVCVVRPRLFLMLSTAMSI